ncbi:MAG: serine/threonine protein kinase [Candidatus Diapherotrites archaeon]|uniref:non-specific serine/threonine protein kinase n=1 Tax=Candidatus Iainarchaeum sp. TaxID=3101447 RepID=A0A2D6LPN8_9ARCH|nr:serine/threonine protein kinase [Candidatus Diapherotrites archaeon]|tara:strand:- start:8139 stop:8906 length:768 start_codon:yes stop_codon:yes gene_type:complete
MIETEEFEFEVLKRRFKQESDRKTFAKVFDDQSIKAVHSLANKGLFDVLEHIISTGKEAHVFAATDVSGNLRAVKIFKKETTDFKRMQEYIVDDRRFQGLRKDRRNLVFAWAKKEYKNLMIANKAGLSIPVPLGIKENVIVMEFVNENNKPAKKLKETKTTKKELETYLEQIVDFMAGLYKAGLVHADLSEYNILVKNKNLVIIDFAQAVLLNHPKARDFFERDVRNIAKFFSKKGLKISFEALYEKIKARKNEL